MSVVNLLETHSPPSQFGIQTVSEGHLCGRTSRDHFTFSFHRDDVEYFSSLNSDDDDDDDLCKCTLNFRMLCSKVMST